MRRKMTRNNEAQDATEGLTCAHDADAGGAQGAAVEGISRAHYHRNSAGLLGRVVDFELRLMLES